MEQLIRSLGNLVYLDANVVVYAVEGYPAFRERICALLEAMDRRTLRAVTGELTLAEVLVNLLEEPSGPSLGGRPGIRPAPSACMRPCASGSRGLAASAGEAPRATALDAGRRRHFDSPAGNMVDSGHA